MNRTGLVLDNVFLQHYKQVEHPESPIRLLAIKSELEYQGLLKKITLIPPRLANDDELQLVHDKQYIQRLEAAASIDSNPILFDGAWMCRETPKVARLAVGATLNAVSAIASGALTNAFCIVRPPGHHAERSQYVGFCYYCTPAIAAKFLKYNLGYDKVFVFDFDYHGGNGTQHALELEGNIYYASMHGDPSYAFPHNSGFESEIGIGCGIGRTLNVTLPEGASDLSYLTTFHERVLPAIENFSPDFILVSAGFDLLETDPIGKFKISISAVKQLSMALCNTAHELCGSRIVFILEGGYSPSEMAICIAEIVKVLIQASE